MTVVCFVRRFVRSCRVFAVFSRAANGNRALKRTESGHFTAQKAHSNEKKASEQALRPKYRESFAYGGVARIDVNRFPPYLYAIIIA